MKRKLSLVPLFGILFLSSSSFAAFTFTMSEFKANLDDYFPYRPKICSLHLKEMKGKEIPTFVGPGLLFRVQIVCENGNVSSTDLVRDPDLKTVEQIYTDLLPEFTGRKLVLKLNQAEDGGMTYIFVRK